MKRRDVLRTLASLPVALSATSFVTGCREKDRQSNSGAEREQSASLGRATAPKPAVRDQPTNFGPNALALLDEVRERGARYFFECADPETGLVFDRAPASGRSDGSRYRVASIAATGFGLSALCVAARNGYLPASQCEGRILTMLRFLATRAEHKHGFFAHYLDPRSGERIRGSEFSSIDTSLLLGGVFHAGQCLNSNESTSLLRSIYERIDWLWMLDRDDAAVDRKPMLSMGWLPESGFLKARWSSYSECLMMYLLAIGSPTHPLPPSIWNDIERNTYDYGGIRYISSFGALFIHQYPHIWLDLRGMKDQHTDYYQNSIAATRAHKTYCMLQHGRFPWIDERVWGFSACDTERGDYMAWAALPIVGEWDGTISPHAAAGSLTLLPEECIVALLALREHHPRSFERYGFVDALNPGADNGKGWFDQDVIGIDVGLTMLMAENQQTSSVQKAASSDPILQQALNLVNLQKYT